MEPLRMVLVSILKNIHLSPTPDCGGGVVGGAQTGLVGAYTDTRSIWIHVSEALRCTCSLTQ